MPRPSLTVALTRLAELRAERQRRARDGHQGGLQPAEPARRSGAQSLAVISVLVAIGVAIVLAFVR